MLSTMEAARTLEAWRDMRQRREVRATANRLVNFDDANLRRSAQAAVAACARVERAMEILGEDMPDHLAYAGNLRLTHRDASLDELGHHATPPMTKDAVAGRIRRLLALADKVASERGIPGTDANLPDDFDVD
jgi:DNA-binding protein WhiA